MDTDYWLGRVIWLFLLAGSLFSAMAMAIGAVTGVVAFISLLLETMSTRHVTLFSLGCLAALALDYVFPRAK